MLYEINHMKKNKISFFSYAFVLTIGLIFCWIILPEYKKTTFVFYVGTLLLSMAAVHASEVSANSRISKFFFWFGIFIFGIPQAFHNPTMSIDDYRYLQVFEWAGNYSFNEITLYFGESGQEKGYLLLNWILNKLTGGDYTVFRLSGPI